MDIFEDFKGYLEYTRKEEIPGDRLEIRADDFSYQADEGLLGKIDAFMECQGR